MSAEHAIRLENVSFTYNHTHVLENVDLTVSEGDFACVVGPNGGGKTTLFKIMLGLLAPDRGRVHVLGQPVERARKRVGYMPQYVHHDPQFPITVLDIVLMGRLGRGGLCGVFGWYKKSDRTAALQALEELEMTDSANHLFSELSGGERQRVLIARALSCHPDLLLLDEPTSNVDAATEARLFEILKNLNKRMTILVVSHDLGFVSTVVNNVICVNRKVVVHPTTEVTGEVIRDIYGSDLRMVRHDHRHEGEGHA